jgi:hypothetical protein
VLSLTTIDASNNLVALGMGGLIAGILIIVAIKTKVIPGYRIKWGIAITGILVGIILIAIGILNK